MKTKQEKSTNVNTTTASVREKTTRLDYASPVSERIRRSRALLAGVYQAWRAGEDEVNDDKLDDLFYLLEQDLRLIEELAERNGDSEMAIDERVQQ